MAGWHRLACTQACGQRISSAPQQGGDLSQPVCWGVCLQSWMERPGHLSLGHEVWRATGGTLSKEGLEVGCTFRSHPRARMMRLEREKQPREWKGRLEDEVEQIRTRAAEPCGDGVQDHCTSRGS